MKTLSIPVTTANSSAKPSSSSPWSHSKLHPLQPLPLTRSLNKSGTSLETHYSLWERTNDWGSWLASLPFQDFFTGTFRDERTSPRACLGCVRSFRKRLSYHTGCRAQMFVVVEGDAGTRMHVHALLSFVEPEKGFPPPPKVRRRQAWDLWHSSYGRAECRPIIGSGAGFYVAKYLCKGGGAPGRSLFLTDPGWGVM